MTVRREERGSGGGKLNAKGSSLYNRSHSRSSMTVGFADVSRPNYKDSLNFKDMH